MDRLDHTLPLGDVAEGACNPRINLRVILRKKFGAVCSGTFTESGTDHLVPLHTLSRAAMKLAPAVGLEPTT